MDAAEARQHVTWIKSALEDARSYLLELYEREGWRALGYDSWRACVQAEFGQSERYLYYQLEAAQTERVLMDGDGDLHKCATPIPESHLRALAPLAKADPEQAREVWREVEQTAPNGKVTAVHVNTVLERREQRHPALYTSESPEWYTPESILRRAVQVMGAIDLDPCADPGRRVPAARHYTAEDDGLAREWGDARVWLNPPYSRAIEPWIERFAGHVEAGNEAMALLAHRTDTAWWNRIAGLPIAKCEIKGRLRFSESENSAPFPSVVVYAGDNLLGFYEAFQDLGVLWLRYDPEDAAS